MRRLATEVVGTALLLLFGASSVLAALGVGKGTLDYAGLGFRGPLLRHRRGLSHLRLRTGVRSPHQPGRHDHVGRDQRCGRLTYTRMSRRSPSDGVEHLNVR